MVLDAQSETVNFSLTYRHENEIFASAPLFNHIFSSVGSYLSLGERIINR